MKKFLIGGVVALSMILPLAASAATLSSPLFSNGQTTIDATGGSTVSGTFTLNVGPGEVVEWLRSQADTMPFSDTSVGGTLGYQEGVYLNVPFSVKVSPNTGTYNATEQGAGTFGGNRSINGGDNIIFGPSNLGTVRVVADASTGGSSTGGSIFGFTSFADFVAGLKLALGIGSTPAPTPTPKPACPPAGTTVQVQAWLMANGYAAGFNAVGVYSPTGYWGAVTTSAYNQASAACK